MADPGKVEVEMPFAAVRMTAACMMALPLVAVAATPYDGVYKGGNTLNGGGGTRCPAAVTWNVVVRDGKFEWRIGNETAVVEVRPDGSFTGQSGNRFINGRIANGTLTAATSGSTCNYTWAHSR